jgi:hypothetical protein
MLNMRPNVSQRRSEKSGAEEKDSCCYQASNPVRRYLLAVTFAHILWDRISLTFSLLLWWHVWRLALVSTAWNPVPWCVYSNRWQYDLVGVVAHSIVSLTLIDGTDSWLFYPKINVGLYSGVIMVPKMKIKFSLFSSLLLWRPMV